MPADVTPELVDLVRAVGSAAGRAAKTFKGMRDGVTPEALVRLHKIFKGLQRDLVELQHRMGVTPAADDDEG